ncbi:flagellar hook-basal body complex protein FliE [Primorskyibacter sp. S87]|uniref:flagellar hook-basal body complex protein FliE n=1 Tax=Primorskyibacter sp. S87 TaxID=3415126 RepID=UPI003C7CC938
MDVHSTAAVQAYKASRPATEADPNESTSQGLKATFRDFAHTMEMGEQTALAAMSGKADPHSLVQALAQTELAVETAVTVRNKVVEAYQEILRMPV